MLRYKAFAWILISCLALNPVFQARAQSSFEVASSTAAPAQTALEEKSDHPWILWTVGAAVLVGLVYLLANSGKKGSGGY